MKLHRLRSLGLLSALSLALAAPALAAASASPIPASPTTAQFTLEDLEPGKPDYIVAVAEDRVFTLQDLKEELGRDRPGLTARTFELNLPEYVREAANTLINNVLIVKEFEKDGKRRIPDSYIDEAVAERIQKDFNGDRLKFLHTLNAEGETPLEYRKWIKEQIIVHLMETQARNKNPVVSPERMAEYYQANQAKFVQDDEVRYRKIEFDPRSGETDEQLLARAQAVADRIKAGESFAAAASDVNPRAERTGDSDLEWTKLTGIAPAFAAAIAQQAKGGITDPILSADTPKFCFIFLVVDRHFKGQLTLEQASPEIENDLKRQMQDEAYRKWIGHLREEFFWRIY
jgi:parvulin-like peptidyl-prolyl isomerase